MSSQHQRTSQLGKKKSSERTRITHNNNGTTIKQASGSIDSCLGLRAKRRRLCPNTNRIDSRGDSLLVVYDRKAKEVVGVKEDTANISDSYTIKSHNKTNNNSRKKNSNTNINNKRVSSTNNSTGPNQTGYGDGNNTTDIGKVDCLVTKSSFNDSQKSEITSRGGEEEKKSGCFQFKSVKKSSTIKGLSSTKASKNKKKDRQKQEERERHHSQQITSTIIKTSSSLKKKISSGSVQTTTQRPTPRQTTHKERKWNNKWKLDFPWLERGVNHNGREVGMCLWCRSAGKRNSFANDGSTNLQYSAFQRHQTNREHGQAALEKQILKQGTKTADCSNLKAGSVRTERASTSSSSSKQTQPHKQKVKHDELGSPSSTSSSALFYLTNQAQPAPLSPPSMVQPVSVYPSLSSSSYQQQHHPRPIASPSYSTACIDDNLSKTRPSQVVTSFYDDDDEQNTSTCPQRVFLLSKKAPPLQLSGDLLILQVGVG